MVYRECVYDACGVKLEATYGVTSIPAYCAKLEGGTQATCLVLQGDGGWGERKKPGGP